MRGDDLGTQKDSENSSLRKANEPALFLRCAGIMLLTVLFLSGCKSMGVRDYFADDQVPQSAKDEPRLVASPSPITGNEAWPLLGDVPSKPNDFSPKPVYDHYMDELAYDRGAAQAEKKEVESQEATMNLPDINMPMQSDSTALQANAPVPPQFGGR